MPVTRLGGRLALFAGAITACVLAGARPAPAASAEGVEIRLKALQEQIDGLRQELQRARAASPPAPAPALPAAGVAAPGPSEPAPAASRSSEPAPAAPGRGGLEVVPASVRPSWLTDFRLGGYGSVRFEASDVPQVGDTFTFRRFVLTGDATVAERLRGLFELELERFTELEVERTAPSEDGARGFSQSIEGSHDTEISLEQAWLEFALAGWARFRAGAVLVPLGRFNLSHDDDRWDLPRRPLVDRGVPVLPSTAAWTEVGMGFTGEVPTSAGGTWSYQVYVMNGVSLDSSIETVARGSGELEAEVEVTPRRGTADLDLKKDKAGALRLAWSPAVGDEIAASVYYGRYTPRFLPSEPLWAFAVDGTKTLGPLEIEAEYAFTRFEGIRRVARGFARQVQDREIPSGLFPLSTTVEFELAGLAETRQGYWVEVRYRFMPEALRGTFLARGFENPQVILTARGEQVWLQGLVREVDFSGGVLQDLDQADRQVNRVTLGLAYRPVPLVVFQLALERTWTDRGQSLSSVTNFIPAGRQSAQNALLFGVAFGF